MILSHIFLTLIALVIGAMNLLSKKGTNKHTIDRFKIVADKDMRNVKYS